MARALLPKLRLKEIRKVAEGLIALGVKEKDNFETVKVTAKVARKDKDGKRVKEVKDGKKLLYMMKLRKRSKRPSVQTSCKKTDAESSLHSKNCRKGQEERKEVDMVAKIFDEIAPKYATRNGGYTRIVKIGQRKGDGAMEVLLGGRIHNVPVPLSVLLKITLIASGSHHGLITDRYNHHRFGSDRILDKRLARESHLVYFQ